MNFTNISNISNITIVLVILSLIYDVLKNNDYINLDGVIKKIIYKEKTSDY